jgi:hypothetical protein
VHIYLEAVMLDCPSYTYQANAEFIHVVFIETIFYDRQNFSPFSSQPYKNQFEKWRNVYQSMCPTPLLYYLAWNKSI